MAYDEDALQQTRKQQMIDKIKMNKDLMNRQADELF
jgi:hypothetical protein